MWPEEPGATVSGSLRDGWLCVENKKDVLTWTRAAAEAFNT
jgi:hypothetical protein